MPIKVIWQIFEKTGLFVLFGMPSWLTARVLDFGLAVALAAGLAIAAFGTILWRAFAPLPSVPRAVMRLLALYALWFGAAVMVMALFWNHWHLGAS